MDKKRGPSVLITTYASTCCHDSNGSQQPSATKSERSTEFFTNSISIKNSSNNGQVPNKTRVLYELNQIKGPSGSVRGHKDVVRKSLESLKVVASSQRNFTASNLLSFGSVNSVNGKCRSSKTSGKTNGCMNNFSSKAQRSEEVDQAQYLARLAAEEQDLCVAYTTSLGVIRRTFDDSSLMRSILNLNLIRYEERDIYLNQEYKQQLRMRLKAINVPALFVDGRHLGGIKELELMNESGKLSSILAKFKMSKATRSNCLCCGNARFIACQSCNGSRKSTIHHFKFNSVALRCIKCDRNEGLIPCPLCASNTLDCNNNDEGEINDMNLVVGDRIKL